MDSVEVDIGLPVVTADLLDHLHVRTGMLPAGTYASVLHSGDYSKLVETTAALLDWAKRNKFSWNDRDDHKVTHWAGRVEHYLVGSPLENDPRKWQTEIAILTDEGEGASLPPEPYRRKRLALIWRAARSPARSMSWDILSPMRSFQLLSVLALGLSSCAPAVQAPVSRPVAPAAAASAVSAASAASRVSELADAYMEAYLKAFPENLTWFSLPGARHDRLTDNSPEGLRAWHETEDRLAAALAAVEPRPLVGTPDWVTFGFLREALESSRGLRVCRNELWPANQMSGWQANYAQLAAAQPVGSPELRAQALERWRDLPRFIDQEIANLREGIRLGYSTPKRSVARVIEQFDGLLALSPEQSPFYSPAERDDDPAFRKAWMELLRDGIYPAAERYRAYLRDEYLPAAREPLAVSANPDGAACYAASLRFYTTLEDSPRAVFDRGERAIAARERRIQEKGRELYGTGDLDEIRRRMSTDPADRFSSRDEILSYSQAAVERAKRAVPQWFGRVAQADVVIRPQSEIAEKSSSSQYLPASEDGSRPGIYEINLYRPENQRRGAVEMTAFHETWPGHHLQMALAQEHAQAHPVTRFLFNSGFTEGWARYCDTILADEMGLYSSDLSRLTAQSTLPSGMVLDTGIHALGWTRQQAVDYILAKRPSITPERAEAFVDRISVLPGQLTSYDVGAQEILALREEARQALGARFDIRELHDKVLENGSITLGMLREVIRHWITTESAKVLPSEPLGHR